MASRADSTPVGSTVGDSSEAGGARTSGERALCASQENCGNLVTQINLATKASGKFFDVLCLLAKFLSLSLSPQKGLHLPVLVYNEPPSDLPNCGDPTGARAWLGSAEPTVRPDGAVSNIGAVGLDRPGDPGV